jgi:uncharacterized protein YceK
VRYFQNDASYLPFDERIAALMDLPVSAAFDTVLLPVSVFMKPKRPSYGFSRGCQWVMYR